LGLLVEVRGFPPFRDANCGRMGPPRVCGMESRAVRALVKVCVSHIWRETAAQIWGTGVVARKERGGAAE